MNKGVVRGTTPAPGLVDIQVFRVPANTPGGSGSAVQSAVLNGYKPAWARKVRFKLLGAGSGGGSGRKGAVSNIRCGGGGGAAGAYTEIEFDARDLPDVFYVRVGVGGSGGAAQATNSQDGAVGTAGGDTQVLANPSPGAPLIAQGKGSATGGGPGTASTGTASVGGPVGLFVGAAGAAASTTGLVGGGGSGGAYTGGGGSGGGLTNANPGVESAGGVGGSPNIAPRSTSAGAARTTGANGTDPAFANNLGYSAIGGQGGVGGGSSSTNGTNAGDGGNGGRAAGGGGGGAGLDDNNNSGAGGRGGDGIAVIECLP